MHRFLFCKIMQDVCVCNFYFLQRSHAYKVINIFFHSKIYECNKNVGLWLDIDAYDKYYKIKENIATNCLKQIVKVLWKLFEVKYLWQPSRVNIKNQMAINA